jgi:hypothetical protein
MSTLTEIEAAAKSLPRRDKRKLFNFLAADLEAKPKRKKFVSAHDLMKDLCGIVRSGVGDLSTNKKHLEGMGR